VAVGASVAVAAGGADGPGVGAGPITCVAEVPVEAAIATGFSATSTIDAIVVGSSLIPNVEVPSPLPLAPAVVTVTVHVVPDPVTPATTGTTPPMPSPRSMTKSAAVTPVTASENVAVNATLAVPL
jgi:hypothetical protein